jgi:tetratricopeptide (TPR) repeat protein/transglutaminase-like putative cysteine protease
MRLRLFSLESGWRIRLVLALVVLSLLISVSAFAADPLASYDEQGAQLARQVLTRPNDPESLLDFYSLRDLEDRLSDPDLVGRTCKALAAKRLPLDLRMSVNGCLLDNNLIMADFDALAKATENLGVINRYMVIGPFDNEGGSGMNQAYGPESGFDPSASFEGKQGQVSWRLFPAGLNYFGALKFKRIMVPDSQSLAYAYARVHSKSNQKAVLWVALSGEAKIWLNGALVYAANGERRFRAWQDAVPVTLTRGVNELVVKNGVRDGDWLIRLALLGSDGKPLRGVSGMTASDQAENLAAFPQSAQVFNLGANEPPKPLSLTLETLMKRYEKNPSARLALAISKLSQKRANFPKETRIAEEWEDKALELAPQDAEVLLWCNTVYSDVNKRFGCLTAGHAQYPDDPRFAVKLAAFFKREQQDLKARKLLEPVLDHPAVVYAAQTQMMSLESDNGLSSAAYLRAQALARRFPSMLAAQWKLIRMQKSRNEPEKAVKTVQAILDKRPGHRVALTWMYDYHLERREVVEALAMLDRRLKREPYLLNLYMSKAWLLDGLGRMEEARTALETLLSFAPDNTDAIEELAQLEHRRGNDERALALYDRSLEIHPQNPSLKRYLQILKPSQERFEKPYILDIESAIADNPPPTEGQDMAEVLADIAVWKVFENGLSSEYHQQIARVLDDNGVKRFRSYTVSYTPQEQMVKILQARIVRPDGSVLENVYENDFAVGGSDRMYYNMRMVAVSFPDLEPGDVVEFQYRIDDIGRQNLFADYFGTMRLLQSTVPVKRWETVVLMPPTRTLYTNTPRYAAEPMIDELDGVRRHIWQASDLPKINQEPESPNLIEIADFLHISTFKDWQEMGDWYWGLIKDQFIAKDELKQKVAELIKGIDDPKERIRVIHEWVVTKTRYVALEFGIHSFKPYQVNQIYQRKFGDCKDKATLLVTMLKEAGIDAQIAIIRAGVGKVPQAYPPSLAMFNHAIAYLPDYDLYLDGTAEYAGMDMLPFQDRGGQVMLVSPEGTRFTTVPDGKPEDNQQIRVAQITLDAAGYAIATVTTTQTGTYSSMYRRYFQDVERRKEMLEKLLNSENPGAELLEFSFTGMEDINAPVVLTYRARMPKFVRVEGGGLAAYANLNRPDLVAQHASLSQRDYPVEIKRLTRTVWRTEMTLPAGMTVSHLPDSVERENDAAKFIMRTSQQGGRIVVEGELVYKTKTIGLDLYPAFREFCQDVTQAFREEIRLSNETIN